MPDLTKPMTDEQIAFLDHFEKAQLYHNVYIDKKYDELPRALREFYTDDPGLRLVKSTIHSANIKEPYEIQRLIRALKPSKPQSHQEIYVRAQFLADVCDTTVEKILRSKLFSICDFIPDLSEDAIEDIIKNKNTGLIVPLDNEEYTPSPDQGGSGSGDEPTPTIDTGDYGDEKKIYFTQNGTTISCDTEFDNVIANLPKLPAAELVLDAANDYQNVLDISSGYNTEQQIIDFNFFQMYGTTVKIFTIHYTKNGITMEENTISINGGQA